MKSVHFDYNLFQTQDHELQKQFHEYLLSQFNSYSTQLSDWHDQLCFESEPKIKDWWYAFGSRLIAWQPPIYHPLYYAVAIKDFARDQGINKIKISSCPPQLESYIREMDKNVQYQFEYGTSTQEDFKAKLKFFLSPYWELTKLFRDALFSHKKLQLKPQYQLTIYSQFWGLAHYLKSGEHFFGTMLNNPPSGTNVLWVYNPSKKITEDEKNKMAEILKGKDLVFMEDYWTLGDAFHITARYLRYKWQTCLKLNQVTNLKIHQQTCQKFTEHFVQTMVKKNNPLTELKVERFFQKLHQTIKTKKIIFPFEDKGLERAIILATHGKSETLGYAHAVHNPGHLYLRKKPTNKGYPPRPDKIICTGPNAAQWLRDRTGLGPDRVVVGGSNRHRDIPLPPLTEWKPKKVLFLSGQGCEVRMLANWVDENPQMFDGLELTVRKYPYDEIVEQEKGVQLIQKHCPVIQTNQSLFEQVAAADIVLFTSTSSGLEAIMGRKLAIYAHLHFIVPLDPFLDKGDSSSMLKCMNSQDLISTLQRLRFLSPQEVTQLLENQKAYAISIYAKPDLNFLWK